VLPVPNKKKQKKNTTTGLEQRAPRVSKEKIVGQQTKPKPKASGKRQRKSIRKEVMQEHQERDNTQEHQERGNALTPRSQEHQERDNTQEHQERGNALTPRSQKHQERDNTQEHQERGNALTPRSF